MENYMKLELSAISENEGFARSAVAAFALGLNPSMSELSDIKTAVSEAVTNCIVHAYKGEKSLQNKIIIECGIEKSEKAGKLHICVIDFGCGIENVDEAMQPFYTTSSPSERAGMGFTIMQAFTSDFTIESVKGEGTKISMTKIIEETGKEESNA
ncbi:MAG: anti-sigma F factor [Clostridiales bacterium]|nr:anti-sigma F factor [Clostridiales bacterium]